MKLKLWAAFSALVIPLSAFAVKFVPASLDELSNRAQAVIHGTVREKVVERDETGRVYTKVQIAVTDTWKGAATQVFTIVQFGGTLGERTYEVDGQAKLEIGEEVVLFLVMNQRKQGVIVGLAQGKFEVREEAGEKKVRNLFHGKDPKAPLTLSSLKAKVKGGRP